MTAQSGWRTVGPTSRWETSCAHLGRPVDSEAAYRRSAELLQPLAAGTDGMGRDGKRTLARTRTLLADLQIRRGTGQDQSATLYSQAIEIQQALANEPASTVEDRLDLGHTLRGQADLLRLQGQFSQARPFYDRAVAVLNLARSTDPRHAGIRNEMALAFDARAWIHREMGDLKQAEEDSRHALELLEALITDFPTVPRHRQTLARICEEARPARTGYWTPRRRRGPLSSRATTGGEAVAGLP